MSDIIYAPNLGIVKDITKSSDSVFSTKMMGDGIMIIPGSIDIVSPFDGTIGNVFKTKHAITLQSVNNTQLILHMGIDTVRLNGEGFEIFVENGKEVKRGDLLAHYDYQYVKGKGYDSSIMIVVFNKAISLHKEHLDEKLNQYIPVLTY